MASQSTTSEYDFTVKFSFEQRLKIRRSNRQEGGGEPSNRNPVVEPQKNNAIRRSKGGPGGEPSIRNLVVEPSKNNAIRRPKGRPSVEPRSIRNRVVEPPKKTLPDLLKEHSLPPGLFPKDVTDFQFDEKTRKIVVTMPDDNWELICNSCVLRFSKNVTGLLERGKLSDINGMKTQTGLTYGKISCIKIRQPSEPPRWLDFTTDRLNQTKRFLEFKDVENGRPF